MTRLLLAGGTDVAEMALFSADALQSRPVDAATLAALESECQIIRFDTGADGAYLLHAYVDEHIPAELQKHCDASTLRTYRLRLDSGRLCFGGVESIHAGVGPNRHIRGEGHLPPGEYRVDAWHTEFPDAVVRAAIQKEVGMAGTRWLALPGYLIPGIVLLVIVLLARQAWWTSALTILGAMLGMKSLYFDSDRIKQLGERKEKIERQFPSIVVAMVREATHK